MADFNYNRDYKATTYNKDGVVEVSEKTLIKNVYLWMCGALVVTALTGLYVSSNYSIQQVLFGNPLIFYGLLIGEVVLVIALSAAINKISATTATLMFLLYSVINGATLSSIFLLYTQASIATTFFVTAGTFGVMAVYGSITNTDLTKVGNICLMALIGIIIATVVNIFLKNDTMDLIISVIGIIVFVALTAYDAQKIKEMLLNADVNDTTQKLAVLGALSLYLDFVNLFLYLLRFLGNRRN